MTGFCPKWLAMRERADHKARDAALRDAVVKRFTGRDQVEIVDLGCGSGSNLRALAPHLPNKQVWRLVDNDPALLDVARQTLAAWADEVESLEPLAFRKHGRRVAAEFREAELATLENGLIEGADLITAAALFDLVCYAWLEGFLDELSHHGLPLYAVLTYNGGERWSPPLPADDEMLSAFHEHQRRDKGFGEALGPRAPAALRRALEARGYEVSTAPSPWRLNLRADSGLIAALAEGSAGAVIETALVQKATVEEWRESRCKATSVEIGHVDLFAWPR